MTATGLDANFMTFDDSAGSFTFTRCKTTGSNKYKSLITGSTVAIKLTLSDDLGSKTEYDVSFKFKKEPDCPIPPSFVEPLGDWAVKVNSRSITEQNFEDYLLPALNAASTVMTVEGLPAFVKLKTAKSKAEFVIKKTELAKEVAKTTSNKISGSISIALQSSSGQKVIVSFEVLVLISRVDLHEFKDVTITKAPKEIDPRNFTASIGGINAFGEVNIDFNATLNISAGPQDSKRHLLRKS